MIEEIRKHLLPLRQEITGHNLFLSIETSKDLAVFMEHHAFAVWDFMTLLKTLQAQLTCVNVPWVPTGDQLTRRLMNEIVLGEESDEHPEGGYTSHFELYCEAMGRLGADTKPILELVRQISLGKNAESALDTCGAPEGVKSFVSWTLAMSQRPLHQVAAAFAFGREDLVPDLFRNVVKGLEKHFPERMGLFRKYLERHIDLDENSHTPLAFKMLTILCGEDSQKWEEVRQISYEALIKRKQLWDTILNVIERNSCGAVNTVINILH
jgi:hypothetical protein